MAFIRKSKPYRPIWAASSTIGHGNSSRSSHSWAGRPHDLLGEVVDPLLDLQLVLVEGKVEPWPAPYNVSYPSVTIPMGNYDIVHNNSEILGAIGIEGGGASARRSAWRRAGRGASRPGVSPDRSELWSVHLSAGRSTDVTCRIPGGRTAQEARSGEGQGRRRHAGVRR